ncbi:MAG: hypothetical protein KGL25_11110 [Gammaproteobacteria bacterium]|nr:hypothetical protein [Gammaproteobacteria bacterium]
MKGNDRSADRSAPWRGRSSVLAAIAVLGAACLAWPAVAASVRVPTATIGTDLQKALHDRYGIAEGKVLQQEVADELARELRAAGATLDDAAKANIEVSIDDAVPTHPTRFQVAQQPSLDPVRSVSRGGARLHAVLRDATGKAVDHVDYDYYAVSLDTVSPSGSPWGDAFVTIERFASQVAKAWKRSLGRD